MPFQGQLFFIQKYSGSEEANRGIGEQWACIGGVTGQADGRATAEFVINKAPREADHGAPGDHHKSSRISRSHRASRCSSCNHRTGS